MDECAKSYRGDYWQLPCEAGEDQLSMGKEASLEWCPKLLRSGSRQFWCVIDSCGCVYVQ